MTDTGIGCFLAICRYKTVSAAAQSLYITQPSLSARLKVLEREVGAQLFYRCKGSREMALTPAGTEFYELAVEYEKLIQKMQSLGSRQADITFVGKDSYYSVQDIMDKYDITRDMVYYIIRSNDIAKIQRGRFTYLLKKDVDEVIQIRKSKNDLELMMINASKDDEN